MYQKIPVTDSDTLKHLINSTNIPLSALDVSQITDMRNLFTATSRTNLQGIETWDLRNVLDASGMFSMLGFDFQGGNLSFPVCRNMEQMFDETNIIAPLTIAAPALENARGMFSNSPLNVPIFLHQTTQLRDVSNMFHNCIQMNSTVSINTENVRDFSGMFSNCSKYNKPIGFSFAAAQDCSMMFNKCFFFDQRVQLELPQAVDISSMFNGCSRLNSQVSVSAPQVREAQYLFAGCVSLTQINKLELAQAVNLRGIFQFCRQLNRLDTLELGAAQDLSYAFDGCSTFNGEINLTVPELTSAYRMFRNCIQFSCVSFLLGNFTADYREILVGTPQARLSVLVNLAPGK